MRPAKIDLDMLVEAALTLMDKRGLAAVSLRNVAALLGVKAPSLYRYIADKNALHDLMSIRIYSGCLDRVPVCATWSEWLFAFARELWEEQRRTPGILELISEGRNRPGRGPDGPNAALTTLRAFGLTPDEALLILSGVQSLVTGWTIMFSGSSAQEWGRFETMLIAMIKGWDSARPVQD